MARIAFIQEELRDRFGIMILSAVLKQGGHACEVFIKEKDGDVISKVQNYEPDIIAFSTMTPGVRFALNYAKELKKRQNTFILMGGPHPTFYPEVLYNEDIDGICIGEGEIAFLELANSFDIKKGFTDIRNLWVKENGKIYKNDIRDLVDINALPFPDRSIYFEKYVELRSAPTKKVFLGRGCPFNCSYCFNESFKNLYLGRGEHVRFSSIDKAIEEIRFLKEKYGMKWLQIITGTINLDKQWFMIFLERYKQEIDIPFLCNVRIDLVDEEIVRKMKDAKCERVNYGIEHGNEQLRINTLKRNMTNKQIVDGGRLFNKYKIRAQTSNIIGLPHEEVDIAMDTVRLNRQVKPELTKCFILQPYPKTEIYRYSIEHGFLPDNYAFSEQGVGFQMDFDGFADTVPLNLKQTRQLKNLAYFFNILVKYSWLEPLIKILINLPSNRFFKLAYVLPIAGQDIKYSRSFRKRIKTISTVLKILFINK